MDIPILYLLIAAFIFIFVCRELMNEREKNELRNNTKISKDSI